MKLHDLSMFLYWKLKLEHLIVMLLLSLVLLTSFIPDVDFILCWNCVLIKEKKNNIYIYIFIISIFLLLKFLDLVVLKAMTSGFWNGQGFAMNNCLYILQYLFEIVNKRQKCIYTVCMAKEPKPSSDFQLVLVCGVAWRL